VREAAENAGSASTALAAALSEANRSEKVVASAVAAMDQIKTFSKPDRDDHRHHQRHRVPDQPSGAERWRRGGACGRQRARLRRRRLRGAGAGAARLGSAAEIGQMITNSSEQVRRGVGLVGEAGTTIVSMAQSIQTISGQVGEIAHSAQQQSATIGTSTSAVRQLDQATQQNAAMFEETSAAVTSVSQGAQSTSDLVRRFQVGRGRCCGRPCALSRPRGTAGRLTGPAPGRRANPPRPCAEIRRIGRKFPLAGGDAGRYLPVTQWMRA
jgi:methyl-accepting chemotaxis protein